MVVEGARRAVVEETILEEIRSPGFQLSLFCDQLLYFVLNAILFFFVVKPSWSSNSPNSNGIFVVVVVVQVVQHLECFLSLLITLHEQQYQFKINLVNQPP